MSLSKSIEYGKEFRNNKVHNQRKFGCRFKFIRQATVSIYKLREYLGLHLYGVTGKH